MQTDVQGDRTGVIDPAWIREQADLITLEEGLTGHPLTGAYFCVNEVRGG